MCLLLVLKKRPKGQTVNLIFHPFGGWIPKNIFLFLGYILKTDKLSIFFGPRCQGLGVDESASQTFSFLCI